MLPRRSFHPEGHLSIGIPLMHSHGLVCGNIIFIGGQADISENAQATCPNDLEQQIRIAMQGVLNVLEGAWSNLPRFMFLGRTRLKNEF